MGWNVEYLLLCMYVYLIRFISLWVGVFFSVFLSFSVLIRGMPNLVFFANYIWFRSRYVILVYIHITHAHTLYFFFFSKSPPMMILLPIYRSAFNCCMFTHFFLSNLLQRFLCWLTETKEDIKSCSINDHKKISLTVWGYTSIGLVVNLPFQVVNFHTCSPYCKDF